LKWQHVLGYSSYYGWQVKETAILVKLMMWVATNSDGCSFISAVINMATNLMSTDV